MNLYLDIDGVLLDYKADAPAEHAVEFIDMRVLPRNYRGLS